MIDKDILKGFVALTDYVDFLRREVNEKDARIKYLENLNGVTEKTAAEKAFLKLHKELVERNDTLQKAALTLLDLSLEFDYGNPDIYTAINTIREGQQ